jgi:hypothetical protein
MNLNPPQPKKRRKKIVKKRHKKAQKQNPISNDDFKKEKGAFHGMNRKKLKKL